MSVARAASRFAKNTDTNNNEEGLNGYADRNATPADRAARRAVRSEQFGSGVTSGVGKMNINITHNESSQPKFGTNSTTGLRSVNGASKFGGSNVGSQSKFNFAIDYTKKTPGSTTTPAGRPSSVAGRLAANKYTPTVTPPRTNSYSAKPTPGRFSVMEKNDAPAVSFGGSAADRMAQFRQAMEKEKAQKEKEEAKKNVNEDEEKKKREEAARKKKEEEDRKKKEEEERKKQEEETKKDIPDSEKMKHMPACKKKREKKPARRTMSISNIVLDWVQEMVKDYPIEITNFSSSWNNGMAFCALMHKFNPDEFDYNELDPENKRHNFDLAFKTGEKCKNIPILLDTEDMVRMKKPEPRSVQTYIQWVWSVYGPTSGYGPTPQEVQTASLN